MIDRPGIIYNVISKRYGRGNSKKRIVFHFEDIIANLQLETIKELGKEKTEELWYKIGKDVGTRYMLLSKAKKPPSFLMPTIIDYMFSSLRGGGLSSAKKVFFNNKSKSLVLTGKNNNHCRKSKEHSLFTGGISAILSCLLGTNVEAEAKCGKCPDNCKILVNKEIPFRYKPNIKSLKPSKNYNALNFPKIDPTKEAHSFKDLIKFGKIQLDKDGKFHLKGKTILPNEVGAYGIVIKRYIDINKEAFIKKVIIKEAEKLLSEMLRKEKTEKDKINFIKTILCAFGLGIPHYMKKNNKILFNFNYVPLSKYGFLYHTLVLNGYLNSIFKKRFKIEKTEIKNTLPSISITYSLN
jgi:hypothetical protein